MFGVAKDQKIFCSNFPKYCQEIYLRQTSHIKFSVALGYAVTIVKTRDATHYQLS